MQMNKLFILLNCFPQEYKIFQKRIIQKGKILLLTEICMSMEEYKKQD